MSKGKKAGIIVGCIIAIIIIVVIATRPPGLPSLGPLGPTVSIDYEVTTDSNYPYLTVRVEGLEEEYGVGVLNPEGKPLQIVGIWCDELTSSYVTTVKFYMHAGVSESGLQKDPVPGEYHIQVMSYHTDKKFESKPVFEGPDVSITNVQFEGGNFKYLGGTKVIAQVYNGGDLPVFVGHMRLLVGGLETDHDMRGQECLPPGATTAIEGRFHLGFLEHGTYPVTVEIYSYREAAYYSERVRLASYETQVSG